MLLFCQLKFGSYADLSAIYIGYKKSLSVQDYNNKTKPRISVVALDFSIWGGHVGQQGGRV